MLSPPRYDVMTLRTGCDYDLGSGFPPDETFPDDRRVQIRRIFVVVGDVSVLRPVSFDVFTSTPGRSRQCVGSGEV